jgi:hypothetical protein
LLGHLNKYDNSIRFDPFCQSKTMNLNSSYKEVLRRWTEQDIVM